MSKKRILVAVMNWGLGHATRSIPVIHALQNEHYEPILASDGDALQLLKKEFPKLTHLELPGYNIQYAKKGWLLNWKIIAQTSHIRKTIAAEREKTSEIIKARANKGVERLIYIVKDLDMITKLETGDLHHNLPVYLYKSAAFEEFRPVMDPGLCFQGKEFERKTESCKRSAWAMPLYRCFKQIRKA